jgi:hypothetical protein
VNKYQIGLAAAALAACFASNAHAVTINNVGAGSIAIVNPSSSPAGQVFNNFILSAPANRSNYVIFDISAYAGQQVSAATLTYTAPGFNTAQTYSLWDFSGNAAALATYSFANPPPSAAVAATIRDDLRSGVSYGNVVVSSGAATSISVVLNTAGIDALNNALASAATLFVIGGFSHTMTGNDIMFQSSGATAQLDVSPVPLPAALPLFASVLAGGGLIAWRRKRKAAAAVS